MKNAKTLLVGVASILAATSCAPTTPSTPSTTTPEPSTQVVLDLETTVTCSHHLSKRGASCSMIPANQA